MTAPHTGGGVDRQCDPGMGSFSVFLARRLGQRGCASVVPNGSRSVGRPCRRMETAHACESRRPFEFLGKAAVSRRRAAEFSRAAKCGPQPRSPGIAPWQIVVGDCGTRRPEVIHQAFVRLSTGCRCTPHFYLSIPRADFQARLWVNSWPIEYSAIHQCEPREMIGTNNAIPFKLAF